MVCLSITKRIFKSTRLAINLKYQLLDRNYEKQTP